MTALYFCECDYGPRQIKFTPEGRAYSTGGRSFQELDRDTNSFSGIVKDNADGQIENVIGVIEVNVEEGTSRDITEDTAIAVREYLFKEWIEPPVRLESFLSLAGDSVSEDAREVMEA